METQNVTVITARKGVINRMMQLIDYKRSQIWTARTKRRDLQTNEDKEIEFIYTQLNLGVDEDTIMSKVQFVKRKTQENEN